MFSRLPQLALFAFLLGGCQSGTAPLIHDFDEARVQWLANRPAAYEFEMAVASSWVPKSAYHRAVVVSDSVISVVDENGAPVSHTWVISIDSLWNILISERAKGNLNSAIFSRIGVPVESDWGSWPSDGGVHYSVRNFARR